MMQMPAKFVAIDSANTTVAKSATHPSKLARRALRRPLGGPANHNADPEDRQTEGAKQRQENRK